MVPRAADIQAAAEVLASGERVAILVGQGAYGAAEGLVELAEERAGEGFTDPA